jgi:hypothetical protein
VVVCGKIWSALHAGENRCHVHSNVLELRNEEKSGKGIIFFCNGAFRQEICNSKRNICKEKTIDALIFFVGILLIPFKHSIIIIE